MQIRAVGKLRVSEKKCFALELRRHACIGKQAGIKHSFRDP
jgi:hypothetical protein